jgi:hypothetical protein
MSSKLREAVVMPFVRHTVMPRVMSEGVLSLQQLETEARLLNDTDTMLIQACLECSRTDKQKLANTVSAFELHVVKTVHESEFHEVLPVFGFGADYATKCYHQSSCLHAEAGSNSSSHIVHPDTDPWTQKELCCQCQS